MFDFNSTIFCEPITSVNFLHLNLHTNGFLNFPSQFYSGSHFRQHQHSIQHCIHCRRGAHPEPLHCYAPELQREGHCCRGTCGKAHSRGKYIQKCHMHIIMSYLLAYYNRFSKSLFLQELVIDQMSLADLSTFLHRRVSPPFPSKRIQAFFLCTALGSLVSLEKPK